MVSSNLAATNCRVLSADSVETDEGFPGAGPEDEDLALAGA
jgi:hypothetical protein